MKILWFEGSSDDLFGVTRMVENELRFDDYNNHANGEPIRWRVHSPEHNETLLVVGKFCADEGDSWQIGVAPVPTDDGLERHIPDWNIHFEHGEHEYSPRLVIEAPDDVQVDCLERG